jgi:hypothetical protein
MSPSIPLFWNKEVSFELELIGNTSKITIERKKEERREENKIKIKINIFEHQRVRTTSLELC